MAFEISLRIAVASTLLFGCLKQVPPPAQPERVVPVPSVPLGPPEPGSSTVLIGADQPAVVHEITGMTESVAYVGGRTAVARGVITNRLCIAPCAVHLKQGLHQLMFESPSTGWGGTGDVQVGPEPSAYRYALGYQNPRIGLRLLGYFAFTFGIAALPLAFLPSLSSSTQREILIGGSSLAVVGVILLAVFRPEMRNGSGVQWTPAPETPPSETPAPVAPPTSASAY